MTFAVVCLIMSLMNEKREVIMSDIQTLVETRDVLRSMVAESKCDWTPDTSRSTYWGLQTALDEVCRLLEVELVARDKFLEQDNMRSAA